jgi:hypothetical protein
MSRAKKIGNAIENVIANVIENVILSGAKNLRCYRDSSLRSE